MTKKEAASCISEIVKRHGFTTNVEEDNLSEILVSNESFVAIYIHPVWDEAENCFELFALQGIRRVSSDLSSIEARTIADEIGRAADAVDEINKAHIVFDKWR